MIPKVIHYCWFGGNPLPESAQKCIASWRKFLPDYEIKEWKESNFDVNAIPYTAQAYAAKKYAFVSDYARFSILYDNGGLYFDTDVEVIRPMDDIIENGPFMGFEIDASGIDFKKAVAPGLGLGANPGLGLYKEILEHYKTFSFLNEDGSLNQTTVVSYITDILIDNGLENKPGIQHVAGLTIYPKEYFNPLDSLTGKLKITENTRSIHWYTMSWLDRSPFKTWCSHMLHRLISPAITSKVKNLIFGKRNGQR